MASRAIRAHDESSGWGSSFARSGTAALAEGRLQHRIAHRLPLGELARANELVEQGELRGCVVVDIRE
jgi:hypothetical protein